MRGGHATGVRKRARPMQRVTGFYLYQVGYQIHPLANLVGGVTTWSQAHLPVLIAEGALEPLITRSVLKLQTSCQHGHTLLRHLREVRERFSALNQVGEFEKPIDAWTIYQIQNALTAFEAVLEAELNLIPLYVVTPKGGMVLSDLIDNGFVCFPQGLLEKVPEALADATQATKCIAFELPTAAGFHLHRANEAVLRAYFASVAPKVKPPKSGNMGDYLKKMTELGVGEPKVIAALTSLKDLHRNPLMHPDQTIDTVEEAIGLMGAVRAAMTEMLKACNITLLLGAPVSPPQPA